jgi:hypothetical protein
MPPHVPPASAPTAQPDPVLPAVDLAALLAQVQQLTETVQALRAQNKALQDQLDAQPAPVPAPLPMPVPTTEIKIATPDPYDGSSDKMEHFLHQCDVYFLGSPALSEHQCVTFMISYMNKGCALSWAEQMMGEVMHPDFVTNWGMFKNSVRSSFSDLDQTMMARLKIKDVKQGHESVDNYIVCFEEYKGFTGFDNAALVESFKEGLTPSILSCCYGLKTIPSTLTAWKEKSRLFYLNYIEQQQQQQHQQGQPQQQQQGHHQPQPRSSHQGTHGPMMPSSSSASAPTVKSEATMGQTCHSKCYHCGSEGHWA